MVLFLLIIYIIKGGVLFLLINPFPNTAPEASGLIN